MMAGLNIDVPDTQTVERVLMPLIYTSSTWGGSWTLQDHATLDAVIRFAGSEGTDRLEFTTPYGTVFSALTKQLSERDPLNLAGSWVRLDMVDASGGASTVFLGQVRGEDRRVMGSDSDVSGGSVPRPKGLQSWSGFGGQLLLDLVAVSSSYWPDPQVPNEVARVGWTPGFNARDPQGLLRGNRSDEAAPDSPTFIFGGDSTWTRRNALDYLLRRFVNKLDTSGDVVGPAWTIGGQVDVLDEDLRILEIGITATVKQLVNKIIAHREGISWGVYPVVSSSGAPVGFEIRIFTLGSTDVTFRGSTLPANPSPVSLRSSDLADIKSLRVATDHTHRAARVRLVGARVVVCLTLRGPELSGDTSGDILGSSIASLVGKWSIEQESTYKAGATGVSPTEFEELHDTARMAEINKTVYQRYALPVGWNRPPGWLPAFDGTGNPVATPAPYQDEVGETLSWIPLRAGFDYTRNPPVNINPSDEDEPEFRSPFVVAENRKAEIEASTTQPTPANANETIYAPGELLGLGLAALKKDFGVDVHAGPNHRLARGRAKFDGMDASVSRFDPGDDLNEHAIDARTLAVTIAIRSDVRFVLESTLDPNSDDGTVIEIPMPEAELWWLAPGTIIDARDGKPVQGPSVGVVLRNDADLYAPVMAGAIARYMAARSRADVEVFGWRPWLGLLGSVLTTVEEGDQTHGVNAPITSVELYGGMNGEPRTVIRAGFAP